ncbi:MAG: HD domain-containing protein [Prevotella sp.]|nr:HD domain-containing protein [Prevotella sp.]
MKIINDPVHGFIKVPKGLLFDIIQHPLVQRLTRIRQLGMSSFVYPGAQHSRFLHSIGAYHLMSEALLTLSQKGIFIFDSEAEAVEAAILMHDIGHGPFSHVLEHTLISGISHESISLKMMEQINHDLSGQLVLAINIFKGEYPKQFLHQLISSQLDMDRLDYLRRDSFFTGVQEGIIGCARIIKMLNVVDDNLVIDEKGIYPIENYLTSRRSMYWQVYLHKTVVACEKILINLLRRAKHLVNSGKEIFAPPALQYFLHNDINHERFMEDEDVLKYYARLDDNDIWSTVKVWMYCDDKIMQMLASNLINRTTFKVEVYDDQIDENYIHDIRKKLSDKYEISYEDTCYLYSTEKINTNMYDIENDNIKIKMKNNVVCDICEASDLLKVALLTQQKPKYYITYQRL